MFDESEILFLDTALRMKFVTRSQRDRLVSFAEDEDLGSVTQVVVDANLMTEPEVAQTLAAIQQGFGAAGGDVEAVTVDALDELFGDDEPAADDDTGKVAKKSGSALDALERASYADDDDGDEIHAPAFPLPQGANTYDIQDEAEAEYSEAEEIPDEEKTVAQQLAVSGREVLSLIDEE
ncbi:MAG: hypothetical protein KDB07_05580 [Planctomycetes bacterium]|nr:hypothetical protein [Planctomycetota bacterium]